MFYRRKILLALIQLLGGEVEKMRLQKLLFLYCQKKNNPEYDFIPYRFGCYSYSAKADLSTMVKKGVLTETEKSYIKKDNIDYRENLKDCDFDLLEEVITNYGNLNNSALISHTYINYPFFAINSTILKDVVNSTNFEKVQQAIPKENQTILFTIGYEGISLEKYLEKLVRNNIKLLVDVRKNALSMKFGFSKTLLSRYCASLNINYIHVPELGIESNKRKNLKSEEDYAQLFEDYKNTTLRTKIESQKYIIKLLKNNRRIALTCFEAEHSQCHRSHLANSIANFENLKVIHI